MLMFVGRYIDVEEGSFRTTIHTLSTDVSRGESIGTFEPLLLA